MSKRIRRLKKKYKQLRGSYESLLAIHLAPTLDSVTEDKWEVDDLPNHAASAAADYYTHFTTDTAPLDAYLSLLEKIPNLPLQVDDFGVDLIRVQVDADLIATNTGHYRITLYPSDRFLELVSAAWASNRN